MSGDITTCIAILCCVLSVVNESRGLPLKKDLLEEYNIQSEKVFNEYEEAKWNYVTNMTTYNKQLMVNYGIGTTYSYDNKPPQNPNHLPPVHDTDYLLNKLMDRDKFNVAMALKAEDYSSRNWTQSKRREFRKIRYPDIPVSNDEIKLAQMNKLVSDMAAIQSTAKVCLNKRTCMNKLVTDKTAFLNTAKVCINSTFCVPLNPNLTDIIAKSRDYNILVQAWKGWRETSGKKMKSLYSELVNVSNEIVQSQYFDDTGSFWGSLYEFYDFEDNIRELFEQLFPLYEHLHAYTLRKLKVIYGNDKFPSTGHIPAHLLGSMWSQDWTALTNELIPFPNKAIFDVTDEMVRQNYTVKRIFETADDFFQSLGMRPMPPEFWKKSMLEKPTDGRKVECDPSAFDFYNGKDFRIKMCASIKMLDLEIAHQKMAQVQYYMHYADQLIIFRSDPNPGFLEAVGDVISLSVKTPEHMHKIGLTKTLINDTEIDINNLMGMALQKLAILPFSYVIDQWRWNVFKRETTPDKYNEEWWNLRCRYQGVSPPVERSSDDFDPGANFHVAGNVPYIKYFVSLVLQFQIHKALCDESGYKGPLHRCDIYNSSKAGSKLSDILKLGSSVKTEMVMKKTHCRSYMDTKPFLEYFKPLMDYLEKENGNDYGWQPHCLPMST